MPASVRPRASARSVLWLALIALACGGAALTGCGQKGQLYLPSQKKSKVPPTQQPQGTQQPPGTPPAGGTTAPAAAAAAPS